MMLLLYIVENCVFKENVFYENKVGFFRLEIVVGKVYIIFFFCR